MSVRRRKKDRRLNHGASPQEAESIRNNSWCTVKVEETAMEVAEGLRGTIQDLVSPDLKTALAKIDDLEGRTSRLEQQMDKLENQMEERFDEIMVGIQTLIRFNTLERRLSILESKRLNQ
jgi:hypothetical protein